MNEINLFPSWALQHPNLELQKDSLFAGETPKGTQVWATLANGSISIKIGKGRQLYEIDTFEQAMTYARNGADLPRNENCESEERLERFKLVMSIHRQIKTGAWPTPFTQDHLDFIYPY